MAREKDVLGRGKENCKSPEAGVCSGVEEGQVREDVGAW